MLGRLLLISLAVTACSQVGSDYQRPTLPVAQSYTAKGGAIATPDQWWTAWHDTALTQLVQDALATNQDLQLAQAHLQQARAVQQAQDSAFWPSANLSAKVVEDQISKNSEMLANIPIKNLTTQFTNYQLGFDASWEVDVFGRLQRQSEAAAAHTSAGQQQLKAVSLSVAAEVARNYLEYRLWQQRLAIAQENARNYQELARLAALLFKVGEGSQADMQRAASNASNYQANLNNLELGARQNVIALSALTGASVQQLTQRLHYLVPLPLLPPPPATGLPSDLLKRRPDLRAAEQELIAANADIGAAVGDLYPRFMLLGNAGWVSIHPASLLDSASLAWSIGPGVSFPLFNKGRLDAQVKAKQAAFQAALANYRKSVLNAVADVELALSRMSSSAAKLEQLQQAHTRQQRLLALTISQRDGGEATQMAVLDAKRDLAEQQDQVLQAQAQGLTALVSLYKALGGGF